MEQLIYRGGDVKALGDGQVAGYLVLFGSAEETDASHLRDFFTPETDFGIEAGAKTKVWYRHGLDSGLDREIGAGAVKVDEVGVWIDAQLDLRDRYVKAVYSDLAVKGKLGWSSGSANHLIRRETQENGAHKILRWPLGLDASLTPDPAEPRSQAVAVKSLADLPVPETLEELLPGLKAQYLGEHVEREMTVAALSRLNDALMYSVVYRTLQDENLTPEARGEVLQGAFAEFSALALATLAPYLGGGGETAGAMKALQVLWGPERPESLAEHSVKVVSAVAELADRLESRLEARTQAGRSLSAGNRAALSDALAGLAELEAVKAQLTHTLGAADPSALPSPNADLLRQRDHLRLAVATAVAATGLN